MRPRTAPVLTQRAAALLAGAAAVVLPGCGKPPGDSYFPLDEGKSWTYRVTKKFSDEADADIHRLTITNKGSEALGGDLVKGPAVRRHTDVDIDYWLQSDASGVRRVASRAPLTDAPVLDNPPRYVLKAPMAVGSQWQAETVPYVLARRNEVPKEVRYTLKKPLLMDYRIEALGEPVQTPAGSFGNCMRVVGTTTIKLYVDAQFSWRDIPLTSTEWYCQGVGLVKVLRDEPSPSRFMRGGSETLELVAWSG